MEKASDNRLREAPATFNRDGARGAASPLLSVAAKPLRAKVFKSGNSLALRLPAALGLEAGLEMDIEMLPGGAMELRKAEPVKRKFDIDKVAGSATSLRLIDPDDRWFEERTLDWGDAANVKNH
jgi:antitoxin VapB